MLSGHPPSLQSALQMDPQHMQQLQHDGQGGQASPVGDEQQPPIQTSGKRRRKADSGSHDDSPSEPRRLRRSHEACARCRGKKIKCDSKYPRCTACATAGTTCNQQDRHRQTLTPRGHTEHIEHRLAQCEALLKRHIGGFEIENIEEHLAREGIDGTSINPHPRTPNFQLQTVRPFRADSPSAPGSPLKPGFPVFPPHSYPPPPPPGYPPHPMVPYGAPGYPPHPMAGPLPGPPPGPYPNIHPAFQVPPPYPMPPHPTEPRDQRISTDLDGTDPKLNDMSNPQALAKTFGVSAAIVNETNVGVAGALDKEDLAVGSSGLSSGRDRAAQESAIPRDTANWTTVSIRRTSNARPRLATISPTSAEPSGSVDVWLPKDRNMVQRVVDIYFTRLNHHRPVFAKRDFDSALDDLYSERIPAHDPGFICSLYLILALGTLSELNRLTGSNEVDVSKEDYKGQNHAVAKRLAPDWPEYDEFFERALAVKPDLRVTISSLQALILLYWYLYTERQGRTLWRLVGSLVRLAVELGLHHDPISQVNINPIDGKSTRVFTDEQCQLRINLWGIVLIHDRGTSILLGRPLAIAPSDANTPRPTRPKASKGRAISSEFSEHFEHSHPIVDIQADIIMSLYSPSRQTGDTLIRNATRIIHTMLEFRKSLPAEYANYFSGTDDWPMDRRSKLVQEITEDQGLTLLKLGISRILLLRALFSLKELDYEQRRRALIDAIVTSHNTIIVHSQLIKYPDIAFFTSPIPLHIAAMVILYGQMSNCDRIPRQTALEDIWLALDMLPKWRWRWERKDVAGGHPLIARLAERVMDISLQTVGPAKHAVLLSEPEWDEDAKSKSQQSPPQSAKVTFPPSAGGIVYGPQGQPHMGGSHMNNLLNGNSPGKQHNMVEVPSNLFYPFYPEAQHTVGPHPEYGSLLVAAAAQQTPDTYMQEERNENSSAWVNVPTHQRSMSGYAIPPA